jgi:hypothetical protein
MRQKYLRAAIDSWARARGSDQASFLFCLEPAGTFPVNEFAEFLERTFPGRNMVTRNASVLGCLRNTKQAMGMAQVLARSGDGFAVVAEEDIEVSSDVLEYFAWARDTYLGDEKVKVVCAHTRKSQLLDSHAVVTAPWFCPLVWGTWRDRWDDFIEPGWGPLEGSNNPESWDNNLQQALHKTGFRSVFPGRSRSVHTGVTSTLMGHALGEHIYNGSVSECYAPEYPAGDFHEIAYPEGGNLWV